MSDIKFEKNLDVKHGDISITIKIKDGMLPYAFSGYIGGLYNEKQKGYHEQINQLILSLEFIQDEIGKTINLGEDDAPIQRKISEDSQQEHTQTEKGR